MSWKTAANRGSSSGSEAAGGTGPKHWSIARRLALSHIVVTVVSYVVFGLYFYQERVSQVQSYLHKGLSEEALSVRNIIRQWNGKDLLRLSLRIKRFEPDNLRPFIRILDSRGNTIVESPGMGRLLPSQVFPSTGYGEGVPWQNGKGNHFLLRSVLLTEELFCGPGGTMQIGINVDEDRQLLEQMRFTLIACISGALAFAFLSTLVVVRLGLKPVAAVSETARQISGHDFHRRIDEAPLPEELVSLASSFNSMLARISDSFDQLSHYSANLAHELRNPINTLILEAEVTLSKERPPEEYRKVITSSLEELGRLSRTIDQLLFLARVDLEHDDLPLQSLDAREEVEEVFDYFSEAADEAGVALGLTGGSATICADQTLLRRAIGNLVGNALAHTGRGGAITVSIAALEAGGGRIAVSDTGCGIEKVHLPRIFDRFYRVRHPSPAKESTGLGLAIVKAIMIMHRGEAAIESEPGVGTTVTLTFPVQRSC